MDSRLRSSPRMNSDEMHTLLRSASQVAVTPLPEAFSLDVMRRIQERRRLTASQPAFSWALALALGIVAVAGTLLGTFAVHPADGPPRLSLFQGPSRSATPFFLR